MSSDTGELKDYPSPVGKVHFARSIPIQKAKADVLLAFKMNGEDLWAAHGAPVRAIVPGWYGMASGKVVDADHRHGKTVLRLLLNRRLCLLGARDGRSGAGSDF